MSAEVHQQIFRSRVLRGPIPSRGNNLARRRRRQQRRPVANKFADELNIFQAEETAAQQYFYAYLTVAERAAGDSELLQLIHLNPWFWGRVHHAMLVAKFVALGRIFDPSSPIVST